MITKFMSKIWGVCTTTKKGRILISFVKWCFTEYRVNVVNLFRKPKVKTAPFVVAIELTNHCPMECVMCPHQNMTRCKGFMSEDTFLNILSQMVYYSEKFYQQKHPVCLHNFGESLLHDSVDIYAKCLKDYGFPVYLSVNPMQLDGRWSVLKRLLKNNILSELILSVDGWSEDSFKRIRGRDGYEKTVFNTELVLLFKKHCNSKTRVTVQMIDLPAPGEEEEKAKRVTAWKKHPDIDNFVLKQPANFDGSIDRIKEATGVASVKPRRRTVCRALWSHVVVLWNGDVVPCCNDFNGDAVLGNINKESFLKIWNSARVSRLRKQMIKASKNNNISQGLPRCCRNCRALWDLW